MVRAASTLNWPCTQISHPEMHFPTGSDGQGAGHPKVWSFLARTLTLNLYNRVSSTFHILVYKTLLFPYPPPSHFIPYTPAIKNCLHFPRDARHHFSGTSHKQFSLIGVPFPTSSTWGSPTHPSSPNFNVYLLSEAFPIWVLPP